MKSFPLTNSLSVSVRLYRALLVVYPKKFRENYETQLVQVFRDSVRYEYHHNGMPGVIDLWLHTFADLLVTALLERLMERSQYMFSPKFILWGGVASLCGGLFWIVAGISPISGAGPLVLALLLGLGGLVGLYSRQAGQDGRLALAGFALGIIGTGMALATLWWGSASGHSSNFERDPTLAAPLVLILSLGLVSLGIGLTLLGFASLRAKTLSKWRGLPLSVGLLNAIAGMTFWLFYYVPLSQGRNPWNTWNFGVYVLYPVVIVLLGLGWIVLGSRLATEGDALIPVAQPPPNSA